MRAQVVAAVNSLTSYVTEPVLELTTPPLGQLRILFGSSPKQPLEVYDILLPPLRPDVYGDFFDAGRFFYSIVQRHYHLASPELLGCYADDPRAPEVIKKVIRGIVQTSALYPEGRASSGRSKSGSGRGTPRLQQQASCSNCWRAEHCRVIAAS